MDVAGLVHELTTIIAEERVLRDSQRTLRARRAKIEESLLVLIRSSPDAGIRYRDIEISLEEKRVRARRKIRETQDSIARLLQGAGVSDAAGLAAKVLEATKGEPHYEDRLTVKKTQK